MTLILTLQLQNKLCRRHRKPCSKPVACCDRKVCFHPGRSLCATRVNGRLDKIQGCGDKVMACILQLMISSTSCRLTSIQPIAVTFTPSFRFWTGMGWWVSRNHFWFFFVKMSFPASCDVTSKGWHLQWLMTEFKSWDLNCSFWPKKEQPWWDPYPSPAPLLTSQMSLGPKNLVMALSYFAMIILNLLQSFIAGPYTHWIWSHGFCTHQTPAVTICGSSSCCWISPAAIWPLARLEFVCCKP